MSEHNAKLFGALRTASKVAGKFLNTPEPTEVLPDPLALALDQAAAALITITADRDAYRALADELIKELLHPGCKASFSAPENHAERANLLAEVHRESWKTSVNNARKDPASGVSKEAVSLSKKLSRDIVNTYPDAMKAMRKMPKPNGELNYKWILR